MECLEVAGLKVVIRQPKRREVELQGRRRVGELARELGLNLEAVLFVRGEDILSRDQVVEEEDMVEVYSAISGG